MSRLLVTPYSLFAILVSAAVVFAWQAPAVGPAVVRKPAKPQAAAAAPALADGVIPLWELSATKTTSQAADDATERKLQAVVDVDFRNEKLRDVLTKLSEDGKRFRVTIDNWVTNAEKEPLDAKVTLKLKGFTIDQILSRLLSRRELIWIIRDGAVHITTPEEDSRSVRIYSLAGLESPEASSRLRRATARTPEGRAEKSTLPGTEYDWVLDAIQSHTTDPWKSDHPRGGTVLLVKSSLIVDQTFHSHREISELLRALRLAAAGKLKGAAFNLRHRGYPYRQDRHIRRQLAKPATLRLKDVPLSKALQHIERTLEVSIHVDVSLLKDVESSLETKLSIDARGVNWKTALHKLLGSAVLDYYIDNGVIEILPADACEGPTSSYVFDVRDLLNAGLPVDRIEKIIREQSGQVWRADGDPNAGSLNINPDLGVVLVNQTRAGIRNIAEALQLLRAHRATARKGSGGKHTASRYLDRVELRYYEISDGAKANELAAAIPVFVEPQAWTAGRFTPAIKVVDGTLIVRQSVKVHQAIQRFLRELEPEPMPNPWLGGLGGLGGGLGGLGGGGFF